MVEARVKPLKAGTPRAIALALSVVAITSASADDRSLYSADELAAIYRHTRQPATKRDPTNRVVNDEGAAKLGQFLFFDTRFSANGKVSCASCHQPQRAFTDGRALAKGIAVGARNSPTLLNAAFNHWYFRDGRTDSLWAQALQPFENPREFGGDRLRIVHFVYNDSILHRAYERVFGPLPPLKDSARFPTHARPIPNEPASPLHRSWRRMTAKDRDAVNRMYSNLGKAIAAYESKLVSGESPFDKYLVALKIGDSAAKTMLSPEAKRGLKLFVGAANCELCHSGPEFTDGEFHNLGLPRQPNAVADPGRSAGIAIVKADVFNATGPYSDKRTGSAKDRIEFLPPAQTQLGKFKTPTLRNVALTAPYMHDGRFASLKEVIQYYADGKTASHGEVVGAREETLDLIPHLTSAEMSDLIALLQTLTAAPVPTALSHPPATP